MKSVWSSVVVVVLAVAPAFAVSKKEIKKILDKNPDLVLDVLRAHPEELTDIVSQAFQQEQVKRQKEEQEKETAEFNAAFADPLKPVIGKSALIRGRKGAKYTLVEYSDFQCPYCGRAFGTVEDLLKKYGKDMRLVYKNMPLPMHPESMPAAEYFEAAALQSPKKAWLFHDKMFRNQSRLGDDFFKQTIRELGLNVEQAEKDAKSRRVQDLIQADIKEAEKFGFTGTPGFLLNGIPVRGAYPIGKFVAIINRLDSEAKSPKPAKT